MIKTARERGLVRVDNLKPWGALHDTLVMLDEHRKELLELKHHAYGMQDGPLQLRCLRDLVALEEKRFNILRKVGLFEGYKPQKGPDYYQRTFEEQTHRSRVEDDLDVWEDHEEQDDYEEGDDIEEDDDDQEEA